MKRTQYCGDVTGKTPAAGSGFCGWVQRRRDHGGLIFIDLRDRTGLVQLVFDPQTSGTSLSAGGKVRRICFVRGGNRFPSPRRIGKSQSQHRRDQVYIDEMEILNAAKTPPFQIEDGVEVDETVRLKYRYLDLRRPELQKLHPAA